MPNALRWIATLLGILLIAMQIKLWTGQGGRNDVQHLRDRVAVQKRQNSMLKLRNDALMADVHDLKTGTDAIEERARSELGMIKPGEIFYQVIVHDSDEVKSE